MWYYDYGFRAATTFITSFWKSKNDKKHERNEGERHSVTQRYLQAIISFLFLFYVFMFILLWRIEIINSEVQIIKSEVQTIKKEVLNNANNPPVMQSVPAEEKKQEMSPIQINSPQEDNNSVTDEPSSDEPSGVIQEL